MVMSEMLISESESITVQGKRKDIFEKALSLVFDASFLKQNMTVTGYLEMNNTLYFTRYKKESIPGNAIPFPFGLSPELAIQFAWEWFQNNKTPIESEPQGDGSTDIGFQITTEGLNSIGLYTYFVTIKPMWFYYGK